MIMLVLVVVVLDWSASYRHRVVIAAVAPCSCCCIRRSSFGCAQNTAQKPIVAVVVLSYESCGTLAAQRAFTGG